MTLQSPFFVVCCLAIQNFFEIFFHLYRVLLFGCFELPVKTTYRIQGIFYAINRKSQSYNGRSEGHFVKESVHLCTNLCKQFLCSWTFSNFLFSHAGARWLIERLFVASKEITRPTLSSSQLYRYLIYPTHLFHNLLGNEP